MAQMRFLAHKYRLRDFLSVRWLIILAALAAQVVVMAAVLANMGRPATADITLAPVAGNPGVCQVVALRPFGDAWARGIQPGLQIRLAGTQPGDPCKITMPKSRLEIAGLPGPGRDFEVSIQSRPVDFLDLATVIFLTIIFDVTGIAIFLRAQNRASARITYTFFTCTALILCLINLRGANYFWLNLLGFTLAMLVRGLSVTFVCLFPSPPETGPGRKRIPRPYIPLLIGVVLAILSAFVPIVPPPARLAFMILSQLYNAACVLIVIGVMAWGLRHLKRQERQFVRMVVVGLLFLLIPLVLNLTIIRTDTLIQQSLVHLIPIPLAVLPLACDYALFRRHLLGTTRMLSRKAMRVLLWLLLASVFLFPSIILMSLIGSLHLQQETLDYIYAGMLVVSLALFPLLWSKVRDAGDQVFYQDFYEYNRSLRDLSAALTRLQGIEQISTFMLPRLATLLNATESGLLLRATPQINGLPNSGKQKESSPGWRMYRHISGGTRYANHTPKDGIPGERLVSIAKLGLTHLEQASSEPLLLDGVLLLALYDGNWCSGFLCLGPKLNLEPYSKEDRSFLSTLASQLSVLEVNSRYLEQAQADAQQMAALSHRVISAQEEERRHLALELHDEALQQAMLVVRQLSDAGNMAEVAEVMPLARSVIASLRRTCLELRPPLLDELGLAEAFSWLARSTEERSGGKIAISVDCPGDWQTRPPANVELALYRVGQEALSNVFKYSGASSVLIRLRREARGDISLLISDNGRGLRQRRPIAESLGLVGMHERMTAIGGKLQIRTSPGRGVTIRAIYQPAPEEQNAATPVLRVVEEGQEAMEEHLSTWEEVQA